MQLDANSSSRIKLIFLKSRFQSIIIYEKINNNFSNVKMPQDLVSVY